MWSKTKNWHTFAAGFAFHIIEFHNLHICPTRKNVHNVCLETQGTREEPMEFLCAVCLVRLPIRNILFLDASCFALSLNSFLLASKLDLIN